jgi:hypothetical protein
VSGVLPDARELIAEAGVVNLDGSLASTAVSSANAQGARAAVADAGVFAEGARGGIGAPPAATLAVDPLGPRTLVHGQPVASFAGTSVTGLTVSSDGGQPGAGSTAAPVSAVLRGAGLGSDYFRATTLPSAGTRLRLLADPVTSPVLRAAAPSCGGSCEAVKATGSLTSTAGAAHSAVATLGGTVAGTLSLFPTETSPEGLLKVTLTSMSATCRSKADETPRARVAVEYAGTVSHRTYTEQVAADGTVTGTYGYSAPVAISSTAETDPLAGIDLESLVGVDTSGLPLRLSDYVQSWSSLTSTAVTQATMLAADGTAAGLTVPGVLTLTSKPLRSDAESTVGLQLGAISCTASDIR